MRLLLTPVVLPSLQPELLIGAAVVSTILCRRLSWSDAEILTGTISWMALAAIFGFASRPTLPSPNYVSRSTFKASSHARWWIIRLAISFSTLAVSLCGRQGDVACLFPLMLPLTLLLLRYLPSLRSTLPEHIAARLGSHNFPLPLESSKTALFNVALTSVFYTSVLWNVCNGGLLFSFIATCIGVIALALVIIQLPGVQSYLLTDLSAEIALVSQLNAVIMFLMLGIDVSLLGVPSRFIIKALLAGFLKAASLSFLTLTARDLGWQVALNVVTFSIVSEIDLKMLPPPYNPILLIVASGLAMNRLVSTASLHKSLGRLPWALLLIPLWFHVSAFVSNFASTLSIDDRLYPLLDGLTATARENFQSLLQRQSSNYSEAYLEYQRRYDLLPPPGFQNWYEVAVSRESVIIDDFDILHRALVPFWAQSGKGVTQSMTKAYETPGADMWLCTLCGDGSRKVMCKHPFRTFDRHISKLFERLPSEMCGVMTEITLLVNHLDEPRVVLPPYSQMSELGKTGMAEATTEVSELFSWQAITSGCSWRRDTEVFGGGESPSTMDLLLVSNTTTATDLCSHPEYERLHGLFIGPKSLNLVQDLVPVLSTGVPSSMGDVPLPSPAYTENEFRYSPLEDFDWNKKQSNLYWVGSTTGGHAVDNQWHSFHRQRFVSLAQGLAPLPRSYLMQELQQKSKYQLRPGIVWDVAFTRINQCAPNECRNQKAYFRTTPWVPRHKAFQSKLVFDTDGNGISGRYYQLLSSSSTPLKQTLFREWHDDRLIPWRHYIPVSQSLEELPTLVRYLLFTKQGEGFAKRIAHQGQEWADKALRREDIDIYVYRLVIELARLQDPNRQAQTPPAVPISWDSRT